MSGNADLADTPQPPYHAVIFTSLRTGVEEGYSETAGRMRELASQQPGFLGVESTREGNLGITVSYWASAEAVVQWKSVLDHREAQADGRDKWYRRYRVRVARVERDYDFDASA